MQTALSEASTRLAISGWGTQRFSGPNATSSATMLVTIWSSGCWNTLVHRLLIASAAPSSEVFTPNTRTSPALGSASAFMSCSKVDLPEPLPPRMHTYCPAGI